MRSQKLRLALSLLLLVFTMSCTDGLTPTLVSTNELVPTPTPQDSCVWEAATSCDYKRLAGYIGETSDLDTKDDDGNTLLHRAAGTKLEDCTQDERLRTVILLVERGADVNAKNNQGQTPLHLAATSPSFHVVYYLVHSARADLPKDNEGKTPKHYASRPDIAEFLEAVEGTGAFVPVEVLAKLEVEEGYLWMDIGLYDDAIEHYTSALELDETGDCGTGIIGKAYELRGVAHYEKGSYAEAVVDLSEAINNNPGESSFYYHRGVAYYYSGDCQSARADLDKFVDPNQVLAGEKTAEALAEAERLIGECPIEPTTAPTPTPTLIPPTAMPTPIPLPIPQIAFSGLANNDEWTPYTREFDGVKMALVPAGCFEMGSTDYEDEQPVHQQCFSEPFWIDVYEVTNEQYGSYKLWSGDNLPRVMVNWSEAVAHCESRGARLPTEAEWEYAARGPDGLIYPWGNEFVSDNVARVSSRGPSDVGSRPGDVSWAGAFDMSGNVWEWVNSLYRSYPYDATDGREASGDLDSSSDRVVHGGEGVRASMRGGTDPDAYSNIGFRCARSYTD
jgi:tetratricopeptide (TPR) repeat protein